MATRLSVSRHTTIAASISALRGAGSPPDAAAWAVRSCRLCSASCLSLLTLKLPLFWLVASWSSCFATALPLGLPAVARAWAGWLALAQCTAEAEAALILNPL